eukprot:252298-Pelagomonas_calceolata.AAC.4
MTSLGCPGSLNMLCECAFCSCCALFVCRGCPYDVIGVSRKPVFAAWQRLLHVLCPKVPIIFDTVDLAFIREGRLALSNNYTMPVGLEALRN